VNHKLILLLSFLGLLVLFWVTLPTQKVEVIFCDVGQGDATLIVSKNWQMLIDTGPKNKKVLNCLENNLPFWDKKIEVVMITHGDNDHSGGLEDIKKYYKIEQEIYSKNVNQYDVIKNNLITFEVLNPEKKIEIDMDNNQNSIAGILKYWSSDLKREVKIFMAADIDIETEQRLVWKKILRPVEDRVDILKVSHHGSKNGTSEEILNILKPKMAMISVGAKNNFGHPTKEVLDRLKEKGIEIRRTDQNGEIKINFL
jgi:competence protein ComEC